MTTCDHITKHHERSMSDHYHVSSFQAHIRPNGLGTPRVKFAQVGSPICNLHQVQEAQAHLEWLPVQQTQTEKKNSDIPAVETSQKSC